MRVYSTSSDKAMSMRGSGSEENATETPEKHEEEACGTLEGFQEPCQGVTDSSSVPTPCVLGFLSSKELVPRILEHEKAFLVIKEHDYAKAPDRPEILQLSSLYSAAKSSVGGENGVISSMREASDALLNCRNDMLLMRQSLSRDEGTAVARHFREVVGLQVALIREQQEQLHEKDRELNSVKKEKEQLQARLERMERRLAISQKHSRSKYTEIESPQPGDTPQLDSSSTPHHPHLSRKDTIINSERHSNSRSSSIEPATRIRGRKSSHSMTPVPREERESSVTTIGGKRPSKRKLSDALSQETSAKKPAKRVRHPREMRTKLEYAGLELPLLNRSISMMTSSSSRCSVEGSRASSVVSNHVESSVNESSRNGECDKPISIPSWRLFPVKSTLSGSVGDCEDLSDDIFTKRHKKLEEDEKRRKRWDIQRTRSLRQHEELLRKYNMKGGGGGQSTDKQKEKVASFLPSLSEIASIEIKETLPVSAFGRPIPLLKASEFDLPWFDLDAREAKESIRTTRSMARARVSSAEES